MSAIEEIHAKLSEIGIINAAPAAYPAQGDVLDAIVVRHHGGDASITLHGDASTTEAVFGLLERALTFVYAGVTA